MKTASNIFWLMEMKLFKRSDHWHIKRGQEGGGCIQACIKQLPWKYTCIIHGKHTQKQL
jgi:hypothetical protein